VTRKLIRVMFAATVVAGISAPMLGASAAGRSSTVDAWNPPRSFEVPGPTVTNRLEVGKDDSVSWIIWEGEHTITPKDPKQWGGDGSGADALKPDSPRYSKTFSKLGDYVYFCSIHGGIDPQGKEYGMWGVIHVKDLTTNTTAAPPTTAPAPPPTTAPPTTATTTQPGATPPATTATAPTTRPGPTAPATTPTTAKHDKDKKKDAKEEETTTTSSTLPPPVDLPNEAIVPTLPGFGAAPGSDAEAPIDTPEGEAVALLKPKKNKGGDAVKLLIVSGLGLGALGVGTAGYKYANRSSKYFPA
jgi:plastocyanin